MSSTDWQPDLEGYALGEITEAERRRVEQYLATHPDAALEVERLQLVTATLKRLPEEEPPRRIAFVSDKVFEPKWYQRIWNSGPRLGFVSAAMLAAAILAHGVMAQQIRLQSPAQLAQAEVSKLVDAEVSKRLDPAVAQVRAEYETKSKAMVDTALNEAERRFAEERQQDRLAVTASADVYRKYATRAMSLQRVSQ